jgi:hypothetical protein
MKIYSKLAFLFLAIAALGIVTAQASTILKIDDPINGLSVEIVDNSPADMDSTPGSILFSQTDWGYHWNFTINAVTGNPTDPNMTQNGSILIYSGSGQLNITFTSTFLSPTPEFGFSSKIAGDVFGDVSYSLYADPNNVPFGESVTLGNMGPFSGNYDSSISTPFADPNSAYSLTQVVSFNLPESGWASYSAELTTATPEPSTLLLLGSGFSIIGFIRLRRKKA